MVSSLRRGVVLVAASATLALLTALLPPSSPALAQRPLAQAQDAPADAPPPMGFAASLLPPGNSGTVTTDGQAEGSAGGSYGENLDDQTDLYWGLEGYAGQGFADPADAVRSETLRDGSVRIYWDDFGVPAIYGDTGFDVWYGAGYSIAQIRLFLMDAVRRMGRGTFAELVGAGSVNLDVQQRTLTYSEEEYQAILDGLSPQALDAVNGYVEGANAWIAEATADPSLLPAEYALLSTTPEPLDAIDVLAAGVLITRTVAAEGGGEMDNVRLLRDLEAAMGSEEGRGVFTDMVWQQDDLAVTSVPREEGVFPNVELGDLDEAFAAAADFAATLPLELADGPGTGDYPNPQSFGLAEADEGAGAAAGIPDVAGALNDFATSLHGGSIAVAIGPELTADGGSLLLSGPQLGYSYPSLLVELEVHGGGYHARGASVPALPTVGIGYTDQVAWALTTGYSKTIDSFIETVRGVPGTDLEYFHDGEWKPAECRAEDIPFREAAGGSLPVGPPARAETVTICRTIHGPIVSIEEGDGERLARSVQYQMFGREIETVEGVLAWNRARSFEEFEAAMRLVTWNENTTYADADGRIAYWHPGLHRERAPFDLRLPLPGDGSADFGELLPFEALPQSVDPAQGYLANWNNKPAHEWLDGVGVGSTSRPGGAVQRVSNAIELVESTDQHSFESLKDLEVEAGLLDPRAAPFLPLMLAAFEGSGEPDLELLAGVLEGWNRRFYDPANAPTRFNGAGGQSDPESGTDGPGATAFEAVLEALLDDVFADVWVGRDPAGLTEAEIAACNSGAAGVCPDLLSRQLGVGGHRYDMSPGHNLLLRVLDPSSSSLAPSRDYLNGRTAEEVLIEAGREALLALQQSYGSTTPEDWRRPTHMSIVNNLTGAIGPSSTQPYMDRGSYIHVVAHLGTPAPLVRRVAGEERVATSVALSAEAFESADTVVLAAAEDFPDALAAAPLAGVLGGPVLLVRDALTEQVEAELERLGAERVIVVGGPAAVAEGVVVALATAGYEVERLAGEDRAGTAAAIAERVVAERGSPAEGLPDAFIVSSTTFADALSIGAVAARTATPILLAGATLPPATAAAFDSLGIDDAVVIGGQEAVSDESVESVGSVRRIAGPGRYETSALVLRYAREVGLPFTTLLLATGTDFPDGLGASAAAEALDGVVVLVDGLDPANGRFALDYATSQRATVNEALIVGGPAAVADAYRSIFD